MMGTPSETARLCPYRISETSRRASESIVRPRKKLDRAGAAKASTIESRAITRMSSISVKAARVQGPKSEVQSPEAAEDLQTLDFGLWTLDFENSLVILV